jgi:DNA polymerase-3 subunit delta'
MKLYGYENEFNKLKQLVNKYSIPLLIYGNPHQGKTFLSSYLIKSLFCDLPEEQHPCNSCRSCKRFDHNNEVDFLVIENKDNKSTLTLEHVEQIKNFCISKPIQNPFKVIFVKDVHNFNIVSQNALLKTLEEPVDFVRFVFTSSNIEYVLDTIKSRSVMFPIYNVEPNYLNEYIEDNFPDCPNKEIVLKYANTIYLIKQFLDKEKNFEQIRDQIFEYLTSIPESDIYTLFTKHFLENNLDNWDIVRFILTSIMMDILYVGLNVTDYVSNLDKMSEIKMLSNASEKESVIKIIESISQYNQYVQSNIKKDLIINNLILSVITGFQPSK